MLTIRPAQITVLEEDLLNRWIAEWLAELHPEETARIRRAGVRRLVADAIKRGRAFGLTLAEDLRSYACVRLLLGDGLETDPDLDWAREFLNDWDPDRGDRVARLEREILARRAAGG